VVTLGIGGVSASPGRLTSSGSLYVDPVNGNDVTGRGTEALPFATIARAKRSIGASIATGRKVRLYLYPHAGSALYEEDEFWDMPEIAGTLEIIGVGTTPKDGSVYTVSSVDTTNRTITLTTDPTVTNGDLSGWEMEVVTSTNAVLPGTRKSVLWNIGATVYLSGVHYRGLAPSASVNIAAGATMRFVEPSVKINTAAVTRGLSQREMRSLKGGRTGGATAYGISAGGDLRFINIQFYVPDGETSGHVRCTGGVRFAGCVMTQNTANTVQVFEFVDAFVGSGQWLGDSTVSDAEGLLADNMANSGLCARARVPGTNPIRPGITAFGSMLRGVFSVGQTQINEGCRMHLTQGGGKSCFDAIGCASTYPHSALLLNTATLWTSGTTSTNGLWMRAPVGGWDLEVNYQASTEITLPIRHVGTGSSPVRCRHHAFANFTFTASGYQHVIEDVAFTTGLTIQYGSQVRLVNTDGASFKSASVGQNTPTVRNLASSPMVAATEVTGSEFCCLHRSA